MSEAAPDQQPPGDRERGTANAAIHDLGYKRYLGTRRPQRTRYRVIVKNVLTSAWRGWWRMKVWIAGAAVTTIVASAIMYFWQDKVADALSFRGIEVSFLDAVLPLSIPWYGRTAFVLSLTVAAVVIANDLRAGAFEFYFSRPVRPRDYVLGKIGGIWLIMASVLIAGPLLLALFRVGMSEDVDAVVANLVLVPKTLLLGTVGATAYAMAPLAFSAISTRPRHTIAAWVGFYLVVGWIAMGVAHGTGTPAIAALDVASALQGLAFGLFDVSSVFRQVDGRVIPPPGVSAAALLGYSAIGIGVVYWRVSRAERAGLGGG